HPPPVPPAGPSVRGRTRGPGRGDDRLRLLGGVPDPRPPGRGRPPRPPRSVRGQDRRRPGGLPPRPLRRPLVHPGRRPPGQRAGPRRRRPRRRLRPQGDPYRRATPPVPGGVVATRGPPG